MKMSEYQLEQFNQYLSNAKKNDEISLLLSEGEDRMQSLYDLCSDYSHVSINSEKIQTDKLSLACLPSENDIGIAVTNTIDFINQYEIVDVEGLMDLICELHPHAIKSEDSKKQKSGMLKDDSNKMGLYGVYFTFNELPKETFLLIKERILKELGR